MIDRDGAVGSASSGRRGGPPSDQTLAQKLLQMHVGLLREPGLTGLDRIAVAVYDEKTDLLKTFVHSTEGGEAPLNHYVARLADSRSLSECALSDRPRVIDDLDVLEGDREHSRRIHLGGFRSSFTLPIRHSGVLYGFLFFNSRQPGFFNPVVVHQITPYAQLVAYMAILEFDSIRMIQAAVKTVREISHFRDEETGGHLDRMSRFARLVATQIAAERGLSDEFVEFLFQFAPLHDVGKVGIPDNILLKPARLTPAEFDVMRSHVTKGTEIVDRMVRDFRLETVAHVDILRNVVAYHHENWDGSGYPHGLDGERIPLEARICAVADVFDALTSTRPYKHAWSNADALQHLKEMSGKKFDPACVDALARCMDEVERIQAQFAECPYD